MSLLNKRDGESSAERSARLITAAAAHVEKAEETILPTRTGTVGNTSFATAHATTALAILAIEKAERGL